MKEAGIRDVIGFHGDGVKDLRNSFEEALDDYLETCEKIGQPPNKPYSGKIMLRVPPEVHAAAASRHKHRGGTVTSFF